MNSKLTLEGRFVCTRGTGGKTDCCPLWHHSLKSFDLVNGTLSVVSTLQLQIWQISDSGRAKTFNEPVNFQWNQSLLSEFSMRENVGLISYHFPSTNPHVLWARMCLVIRRAPQLVTDSSTLQKPCSQKPLATSGQLLQMRLPEAAGDRGSSGQLLRYWLADPQEIKTRAHKPAVIMFLEMVHCTPGRYLACTCCFASVTGCGLALLRGSILKSKTHCLQDSAASVLPASPPHHMQAFGREGLWWNQHSQQALWLIENAYQTDFQSSAAYLGLFIKPGKLNWERCWNLTHGSEKAGSSGNLLL